MTFDNIYYFLGKWGIVRKMRLHRVVNQDSIRTETLEKQEAVWNIIVQQTNRGGSVATSHFDDW
jgi:hypothetical protein